MKNFKEFIEESSLSRIWSATQQHVSGGITGFRGSDTYAQNVAKNRNILIYLKGKGYSVTKVKGSYIEDKGSDKENEVGESSFFVVDMHDTGHLKQDLISLGKLYDQDSVLIVPKGGQNAYLVGTSKRDTAYPSYGKEQVLGNGVYGKVAGQFLSRVRGREFAFEEIEYPDTINGIRGWKILFNQIEEEISKLED